VVASITLRQLLGRRRVLLLVVLGALLVLVAFIYRLSDPFSFERLSWTAALLDGFGIRVVLPLVALILGSGAVGNEIEDGTIVHLLSKPVSRLAMVLTKLAVAGVLTGLLAGIPIALAGLLAAGADGGQLVVAFTIAAVLGGFVYAALFVALSLLTRRALEVGLLYVIICEGLIGGLFAGTRTLSVRVHVLTWVDALAELPPPAPSQPLEPLVAVAVAAALLVGSVVVATRRLESRRFLTQLQRLQAGGW
jgi:ABC-2 type transport system permease protein